MTGVPAATHRQRRASWSGIVTGAPQTVRGYQGSATNMVRRPNHANKGSRPPRGLSDGDLRDRGSATIWVLTCSTLVLLLALVVAIRAAAALTRHRAEAAADLAALAGAGRIGYVGDAAEICGAAEAIVTANGGLLLACSASLQPDGLSGTVSVRAAIPARLPVVGDLRATASARAERLPAGFTSPDDAVGRPAVRAPPVPGG